MNPNANQRVNFPVLPQTKPGTTTPNRQRPQPQPPTLKRADSGSKGSNSSATNDKSFTGNNYVEPRTPTLSHPKNTQQQPIINQLQENSNIYNSNGLPVHFLGMKPPLSFEQEDDYLHGKQYTEADLKVKFRIDELSEESALQQLNRKLQTDLAKLSDQFLDIFVENDRLQKQQNQMDIEMEKRLNQIKTEYDIIRIELESQKKVLELQLDQEKAHLLDVAAHTQRLKDSLMIERDEKIQVLNEIQELKDRLNEYLEGAGHAAYPGTIKQGNAGLDIHEKQRLLQRISYFQSELELCKTMLIERGLRIESEQSQRTELGKSFKRKTKYGRIYYVGEPKSFQEILVLIDKFDSFPLVSKDRLVGLEELCIYMNSSDEAIAKLRSFKASICCTKSLRSSNHAILMRAMHVISFVCQGSESNASCVVELGGITQIRSCLDSPDPYVRIEAVAALEALSCFEDCMRLIFKGNTVARIITLLEEGLQLENDYGVELAALAAKTLSNLCSGQVGIFEVETNGGLYSILRCIRSDNRTLRGVGIKCLANCSMDNRCRALVCDLRATKDILKLLESHEPDVAMNAAKTLVNISHNNQVKEDIRLDGGAPFIFRPLEYGDDEMKLLILMILINLCADENSAGSLCQYGLLNKLMMLMKSTSIDIQRLSAHCISLIVDSGISPEYVYNNTDIVEITDSLDYEEDLETAKYCFKIVSSFLDSPFTQKRMLEHVEKIYFYSRKLLLSNTTLDDKLYALQILPKTFVTDQKETRDLFYKYQLDHISSEILKENTEVYQPLSSDLLNALLQIISTIAEQEYRYQNKNLDITIMIEAITNEQLLENLAKLLHLHIQDKKLDWVMIRRIVHAIEVFCFNQENIAEFTQLNVAKDLMNALAKAKDHGEQNTIQTVISCLAYFTDDQNEWFALCKPDLIEELCYYLVSGNEFMKERAKHCLYDLSFCPLLAHLITTMPQNIGLRDLIRAYQEDHVTLNVILQNLTEDQAFRRLLIASLPHKILLIGQGMDTFEFEFLKRDAQGNLPPIEREHLYTKRQLLDQTYGNLDKFYDNLIVGKPKHFKGVITEEDRIRDKILQEIAEGKRVKDPLKPHEAKDFYKNFYTHHQDEHLHPDESISQKGDELQNTLYGKPPSQGGMSRASFANTEFLKNRNQAHEDARSFINRNNVRPVENTGNDPSNQNPNQGNANLNGPQSKVPNLLMQHIGEEVKNLGNQPNSAEEDDPSNQANSQQKRNLPEKNPNSSFYRGGIDGIVTDAKSKNPFINGVATKAGMGPLDLSKSRAGAPKNSSGAMKSQNNFNPAQINRSYEEGGSQNNDSQGESYYDSQDEFYKSNDQQHTAQGQYQQPNQRAMQNQNNPGKQMSQNAGRQPPNQTYSESQGQPYTQEDYDSQELEEQKGQPPNNQRGQLNQAGKASPNNQQLRTPTYDSQYSQEELHYSQANEHNNNNPQKPNQNLPNSKNIPQQKPIQSPLNKPMNGQPPNSNQKPNNLQQGKPGAQQTNNLNSNNEPNSRDSNGLFDSPTYRDDDDENSENYK